MAGGDNEYCAILVAVNSVLQMVPYASLAILFIKAISGDDDASAISHNVVAKSVAVFLGIPLGAAIVTRFVLRKITSNKGYAKVFIKWASPWSLIGLPLIILVLFASQSHQVVHQIVSLVRVAAPLLVYFLVIFSITIYITYRLEFGYKLFATQSCTATINNFELGIALAVGTFGAGIDEALASTVEPLIEMPVLLALVYVLKWIGGRWS